MHPPVFRHANAGPNRGASGNIPTSAELRSGDRGDEAETGLQAVEDRDFAHHHGIDSDEALDDKITVFLEAGIYYVKNPNVIAELDRNIYDGGDLPAEPYSLLTTGARFYIGRTGWSVNGGINANLDMLFKHGFSPAPIGAFRFNVGGRAERLASSVYSPRTATMPRMAVVVSFT